MQTLLILYQIFKQDGDHPPNTEIMWFSRAPKFYRRRSKPLLGRHHYYIHRPEVEHAKIYFTSTQNGKLSKLLFVFSNKLGSVSEIRHDSNIFEDTLLSFMKRILNNSKSFLKSIAEEIHKAKYHGMKSSSSRSIDFLYLAEDYLREMPMVLNTATNSLSRFLELTESYNNSDPQDLPSRFEDDLTHLNSISELIRKEAVAARQILFEQNTLRQTRQAKLLTILASIYVPMSFITGYFSMNFNEVDFSGSIIAPPKINLYWKIVVPLVLVTILFPLIGPWILSKALEHVAKQKPSSKRSIFSVALIENILPSPRDINFDFYGGKTTEIIFISESNERKFRHLGISRCGCIRKFSLKIYVVGRKRKRGLGKGREGR
ncbi:hypothetical protein EDC01DRAFT_322054 [Geopyxis carbonaria]|nr:hypothetical protein EDC01DRAFT_322054 [Geopyxis carbonaria]